MAIIFFNTLKSFFKYKNHAILILTKRTDSKEDIDNNKLCNFYFS